MYRIFRAGTFKTDFGPPDGGDAQDFHTIIRLIIGNLVHRLPKGRHRILSNMPRSAILLILSKTQTKLKAFKHSIPQVRKSTFHYFFYFKPSNNE